MRKAGVDPNGLGKDEHGLVFTSPIGEPMRPRNFTKEFSRQVKGVNIDTVTLHGFRHTHITHLLKSGVPIKVVSERAGHANITITLSIYAHVLPNMQADAATIMDASLRAMENDAGTSATKCAQKFSPRWQSGANSGFIENRE